MEAASLEYEVYFTPSHKQCLEQQMLRAVAAKEGSCCCTLLYQHGCLQLCLKVFVFWHHPWSDGAFFRTRSLLRCKIFSPVDLAASFFLLWVGLLMRAWGRQCCWRSSFHTLVMYHEAATAFGAAGTSVLESVRGTKASPKLMGWDSPEAALPWLQCHQTKQTDPCFTSLVTSSKLKDHSAANWDVAEY